MTDWQKARAQIESLYASSREDIGEALRSIAGDTTFREAIAWQNRKLLTKAIDPFLRSDPKQRDARVRSRERLLASYLQRYCVKNDSIGFFGPVAWGSIRENDNSAPSIALSSQSPVAEPGEVHLEYWAVAVIADKIAEIPGVRGYIAPRLLPYYAIDGSRLLTPFGPMERTPTELAVLGLCTGDHRALDIAATVSEAQSIEPTEVIECIKVLHGSSIVAWTFALPRLGNRFEDKLVSMIEAIEDETVRLQAMSVVEPVRSARLRLEQARGNDERVASAMEALEQTFSELSGEESTRLGGEIYAARTLTYLDCPRQTEIALGSSVVAKLGPVLKLLGQSARWLGERIADATQRDLTELFEKMSPNAEPVPAPQFWMAATALFPRAGGQRSDRAQKAFDDYVARWRRILRYDKPSGAVVLNSSELAPVVADIFAANTLGWPSARTCSPDIMIAAPSLKAFEQGEFSIVMGELHFHSNTLELHALLEMNKNRDAVLKGVALDYDVGRVAHTPPADTAGRAFLTPLTDLDGDIQLEFEETPSAREHQKTARIADLLVSLNGGQLVVETRDGRKQWPVLFFVDQLLTEFNPEIVERDAHTPRVTIDEVVIARETWRFAVKDLEFTKLKKPIDTFRAVNQWASALGIPRRCFYRPSNEEKPYYLDLESPVLVELFAHSLAKSDSLSMSEMLPTTNECWLEDPHNHHYTAELRMAVVDPLQWQPPALPQNR